MKVYRGQIAGRRAESGYHMICGILEAEIGAFKDEHLYRAAASSSTSHLNFINDPLDPEKQVDKFGYQYSRHCNEEIQVGDLLRNTMWSLLQSDGPSLQLYLRKSTAPSETGTEIFMFSGILKQDPSEAFLASEKMHNIGLLPDQGLMIVTPADEDHHQSFLDCRGSQLNAFLQKPVWGWDSEAWGIKSTLPAKINHQAQELALLEYRNEGIAQPPLSEKEEARRVELNQDHRLRFLAGEKKISRNHETFRKALEYIATTYGIDHLADYVGVSTEADNARMSSQMKEAISKTYEDRYV